MSADLLTQLGELLQSQQNYIHQLERNNALLVELLARYMTQEEIEAVKSQQDFTES